MTANKNPPAPDRAAQRSVGDEQQTLVERQKTSRDQWRAQNRDAINAFNEHVQAHGVFSDGLRFF